MDAYTETELKLRFTDTAVWDTITEDTFLQKLAVPDSLVIESLETVYFDTAGFDLKEAGLTFRIRQKADEWVATVKGDGTSGGGLHERHEWSVVVEGPVPDIDSFRELPVGPKLQAIIGQKKLVELFKTSFERKSMILKLPEGGEVEFCADKGGVFAGGKMTPLLEIELELKGAKLAAALKLGADLARKYSLLPEMRSKYYQGLKLAGMEPWKEEEKQAVELETGDNAGQALSKILLHHLLMVIKTQEEFIANPKEPLTLQQFRIKLRRLCSVISFCKPLIPGKNDGQCGKLRQLGCEMAKLRDLAVWEEKVKSGQFTPLLLDIWAWLLEQPWNKKIIRG